MEIKSEYEFSKFVNLIKNLLLILKSLFPEFKLMFLGFSILDILIESKLSLLCLKFLYLLVSLYKLLIVHNDSL